MFLDGDDTEKVVYKWDNAGGQLVGLNGTHAICRFTTMIGTDEPSLIAALAFKADPGKQKHRKCLA